MPASESASLSRKSSKTPSEGPEAPGLLAWQGPRGTHDPSLLTSQVRAPVSHSDHHFGGRNLLEAGLDGAGVPGHDPLRDADHYLGGEAKAGP